MIKNILTFLPFLITLVILDSCKKESVTPTSALDQRLELISKTWSLGSSSVTRDGIDVTDEFIGFALTVSSNFTYSTVNGEDVWPGSGTWVFGGTTEDPNLDKVIRNDGVEVTIVSISESNLVLSLFFQNDSGGRVSGLDGNYSFNLTSQ